MPSEESSIESSSNKSDDTVHLTDDSPTRNRRAEDEARIVSVCLCFGCYSVRI